MGKDLGKDLYENMICPFRKGIYINSTVVSDDTSDKVSKIIATNFLDCYRTYCPFFDVFAERCTRKE